MKRWLISLLPKKWQNVHKYDKIYHAVGGTLFFLFTTLFFENWVSLILTVILGFGIEIYDKITSGKFDILDAIATFIIPLAYTVIKLIL